MAFDQSSQIEAGENRGMSAQHQFVVTQLQQQAGTDQWQFELSMISPHRRQALAIWLTAEGTAAPVQVVAGWIE